MRIVLVHFPIDCGDCAVSAGVLGKWRTDADIQSTGRVSQDVVCLLFNRDTIKC